MLYVLLGLGVLIGVVLLLAAMKPSTFRVARSVSIETTPEQAFGKINDLREFMSWNPWANLDPKSECVYEGPASGVDASYRWKGNSQVGQGICTITEVEPNRIVKMRLEFIKPFKGVNQVELTTLPDGKHTTVTWAMTGKYVFMAKVIGVFMSMDRMIGCSFEKGLATLKGMLEGPKQAAA